VWGTGAAFEGKLLKLCCYISVTILSLTLIIVSALFFVYNAKTDGDSESIFAELPCYTKVSGTALPSDQNPLNTPSRSWAGQARA
jgi:hypothetical protein